jgi:asparagine synthase (glutamine-hydrolysing)
MESFRRYLTPDRSENSVTSNGITRKQIMSAQFGRWNFKGQPPAPDYVESVSSILTRYGPDSCKEYSLGGIDILYRAFHTTKESHREMQPHISPSGSVITWDGCLHNRAELIRNLSGSTSSSSTDVEIVAIAYEAWGTHCFAKLIGDWALSVWDPHSRSLILAKDFIGTRYLYYRIDNDEVIWSTILDPLVLFATGSLKICEEYIAGWMSHVPAAHLTPYVGINAVPASCYVVVSPRKDGGAIHAVRKYWDFNPDNKIRYRTDAEYEEHFRVVFGNAVQRRLRSDRPVLAELSGGMDSSSIVCMADTLMARGTAETPRLDTISWYNDADPHYDERPYFSKVENRRGRKGYHIDLGCLRTFSREMLAESDFSSDRIDLLPRFRWGPPEFSDKYSAYMMAQGSRVTLSGFGGEQPTGGGDIPTPTLEFQNLIARARFITLVRRLKAWATKMRESRLPLLWEAIDGFLPIAFAGIPKHMQPPSWFNPGFVQRNYAALCRYPFRTRLLGPLPSFQRHLNILERERRLVAHFAANSKVIREIRYPYLDRDFREFAYAIPWEQIVRVGQRRSLMRRALVGIVPDELLNRKHRSTPSEKPSVDFATDWARVVASDLVLSCVLKVVEPDRLKGALQQAKLNQQAPVEFLKRTLALECWLRHVVSRGALTKSTPIEKPNTSLTIQNEVKA